MTTTTTSTNIAPKKIRVIGVPLDLANRGGVASIWGPRPYAVWPRLEEARLEALGHQVEDARRRGCGHPGTKKEGDAQAKYLKEITTTCTKHAELVVKTLEAGMIPLALGGDHSMAAGTVSGVAEFIAGKTNGLVSSGSMRTPTSTRPSRLPVAMCTACRWQR